MARDFKNIKAWQFADDLAIDVYSITKSFPKEELYGLTSQLRRAVISVPTNIAEGANREHQKEYFHFFNIARGSIAEVEYLLHLANRLGYLQNSDYKRIEELRTTAAKTLYGLIVAVKKDA
jgi:four helix bundle protein